jgi:serine/threonine-protein kinase
MTDDATRTSLEPLVEGRFRILRQIAAGGVGTIYEAVDQTTGHPVAVKLLRAEYARDSVWVRRFQREALTTSQLGHPHIVEILHLGSTREGLPYFAMERLEGLDLAAAIRLQGAFAPERIVGVLIQAAHGLAAAHGAGVVHRDLKPGNVYLTQRPGEREAVKILDFGLAKLAAGDNALDRLTKTGEIVGTPEFMSPEQARGLPLDHRTDLYSLGVIAYAMATAELPFASADAVSVLLKHVYDNPHPPSDLRERRLPPLPTALEETILRLLEKAPARRPENALALIFELPGWDTPETRRLLEQFPLS